MVQESDVPQLEYMSASSEPKAPRPKLRFGIASLLFGSAPILLYIALVCYANARWETYADDRMQERIWRPYHLSAVGVGMQAVGTVLGLVAIARREAPTWVAVTVLSLNFVGIVAGFAALSY